MAFNAKAGVFALNLATGNQAVAGVGFQPKVVLFLPTNDTGDGVSVHAHAGFGCGVSSTERWAKTANSENAQAQTDAVYAYYSGACIMHTDPGDAGTADYEADFVSQDTDGFTINISTAPASAKRVGYLALGGSDLTNVKAGYFQGDNATGNQAVAGIGFQPDAVLFVPQMTSDNPAVRRSKIHFVYSLGFATSSTEEGAVAVMDRDNFATSDTARQQRTDACILVLDHLGVVTAEADFVSLDTDGFTVNWTDACDYQIFYLCLAGGQYHVGDVTSQAATGNFSEVGVGFQPSAGIFASFCNAASGAEIANLDLSVGFATSSSARFVAGAVSEDNQADSDCDSFQDDGLMYLNYDYAQGVEGSADFVSWDTDGFTLNQVDADPSGNQIIYLAMGAEAVAARIPRIPVAYYDGPTIF